jgi:hypothetical protein
VKTFLLLILRQKSLRIILHFELFHRDHIPSLINGSDQVISHLIYLVDL